MTFPAILTLIGVILAGIGAGCRTPSAWCRVRGWAKALALTDARGLAPTLLAQTAAVLGAGGGGTALAPCGAQEPRHPESLAVDLDPR